MASRALPRVTRSSVREKEHAVIPSVEVRLSKNLIAEPGQIYWPVLSDGRSIVAAIRLRPCCVGIDEHRTPEPACARENRAAVTIEPQVGDEQRRIERGPLEDSLAGPPPW